MHFGCDVAERHVIVRHRSLLFQSNEIFSLVLEFSINNYYVRETAASKPIYSLNE